MSLCIAQISDLHIRRESHKDASRFDRWLADCVSGVNAAEPDVVIATGDLTDKGHAEEYRRLRQLLSGLKAPYYVLPGNHDDARAVREAFNDHPYLFESSGHLSYALDAEKMRFIALDSTKAHHPGGYLDDERLAWLQMELRKEHNRPVLLALHHPPFAAGVWPMDWLGFKNLRELERIVRANPQIRCVISGHVHCFRKAQWAGTVAYSSPSTRPQRLVVGVGWQFPKLHFEPGGFLVHSVDGAEIRTEVHRIPGFCRDRSE